MIEIPSEFVATVQNYIPSLNYRDAGSVIQSAVGTIALDSAAGIILPLLAPILGLGVIGSIVLSS